MQIKVKYRFIKTSPRKIREVADLIRGKSYDWSMDQLKFLNKAAAFPVKELLQSAFTAAKDKELTLDSLFVKEIRADEGPRLKRRRLSSRGRAAKILKRMTHLTLVLSDELHGRHADIDTDKHRPVKAKGKSIKKNQR